MLSHDRTPLEIPDLAVRQLVEHEERFRTLVTTSSALVWQADGNGRVVVDPAGWRKLTGQDVGQGEWSWLEAVHADDRDHVREAWTAAVATSSPYNCQHRIRRAEGGYAWVVAYAAPIPKTGPVREWIGMLTDVSDRVRVEEARERFIGILGHDLRNPLNAIMMGVELLDDLPEHQASAVKSIGRSAHRMERMIRDVLDFARGRLGGGIPVAPRPCNLREVCVDVVNELKQAYPAREISLEVIGDLRGTWDPDRVEQVVSNLVGNAVTHGTGRICVIGRDEGHQVVLTVHNQGAAIPTSAMRTLFEPFVRGSDTKSLGLGLYIASEIVHAHHGTITVFSEAGEGTTFTVCWPR